MDFNYDQLLDLGTRYGVPVIKALVILIVGWLIAKGVALVIRKLLDKTEIDNKLADWVSGGRAAGAAVEKGISKFVFWLLMLFVFMAVFQVLGLTIITEPLNAMVTKITSFIPNLLAAGVLVLIAWAVATVLRVVVRNLIGAFQGGPGAAATAPGAPAGAPAAGTPAAGTPAVETDAKPSWFRKVWAEADTAAGLGKGSLASTLGDAVFYLVFLLFLPQILDALEMDGLSPVKDMVGEILAFLPNLLAAVIIFIIFYAVGRIVQRLLSNLLAGIGFDRLPEKLGLGPARPGTSSPSSVAGWVAFIAILFLGAIQAFNTLGLEMVSVLANELLEGMFKVLVAVVIFAVGLFLARLAANAILESGTSQARLLALLARVAILIFTGAMALHRADLAPEIVNLAFGAIIVGLGLAAALAFGLGGREAAARAIERWRQAPPDPGTAATQSGPASPERGIPPTR